MEELTSEPWSVYIVRCSDGTLYTGITNDLSRRVTQHNAGRGAKYTRSRLPVALVDSRIVGTKSTALKLEAHIKRQRRDKKLLALHRHSV